MRVTVFVLMSIIGCSQTAAKSKPRYEIMVNLWKIEATKEKVIEKFGTPSELQAEGIVYRPNQLPGSIKSAHFFGKDGKLDSQFILLSEAELQKFKEELKCSWEIHKKVLNSPHTVRTVESGKCISKNITYDFLPTSVLYEVRWDRKNNK